MSAPAPSDSLPAGWSIALDPGVRRTDGGQTLIGGNPLRVMRLTEAGARWLDDVSAGLPIPRSRGSRRLARRLVEGGLAVPAPAGPAPLHRDGIVVVVPVRDDPEGLARTLASIGPVGESVVVDDGSADAAAVARAAGGAHVLRNDRSVGPGGARDRGWRSSTAPVIAFVDCDVTVDEGSVERLLAHFGDPSVAAVAPRIRASAGSAPSWLARYEEMRSPLDLGPVAAAVRPGGRVPYVPTAVLLVRRSAMEDVGGFDTQLRYGEDVDLVWRLHQRGWRIQYEPAVEALHPCRPRFSGWLRQRFSYGTSASPLARRHPGAVAPLRISGWSALAWGAAVAGRPALGAGIGAATTAALVPKLRGLEHPAREAVQIAGKGNLWAGTYVADAMRRAWWPLAVAAAWVAPRARPAVLAAAVIPAAVEWRSRRPRLGLPRYVLLRLADDVAYGSGVWVGAARERSLGALLPAFSGPLPSPAMLGPTE